MFGNVTTLQIILRNEIPRNNDQFNVTTGTLNKVWLIFVLKGIPNKSQKKKKKKKKKISTNLYYEP